MEQEFIQKLKIANKNGNIQEAKKLYSLYFKIRNPYLPISEIQKQIVDDYLEFIVKTNGLDISESNKLYLEYWDAIEAISTNLHNRRPLSQYLKNVKALKIFKLTDSFHWGKHEGEKVNDVMFSQAGYILQCIINFEHFAIENSFFLVGYIQDYPQYLKAIETNLIKQLVIRNWNIDENFWIENK